MAACQDARLRWADAGADHPRHGLAGADAHAHTQRPVIELRSIQVRPDISLEGLESQVSPRSLLGPVAGHLNTLATLLQGALKPSLQRQLSSIAGETAGLAGWLAFDMEDRRAAAAYFRAGI
jgi:hypothetical protein